MPTIAAVANQVLTAGVPVLFLDTCSILDVIRAPARNLVGCVEAATELIGMCQKTPIGCSLVVGSFVPIEWSNHNQHVLGELDKQHSEFSKTPHIFMICANIFEFR